jgi:CheY-like chemotaxis protein
MNRDQLRVLIVEDNHADAELLKEYITETGIEVKITILDDGQRAIDLIQSANVKIDRNARPRSDGPQSPKEERP